MKSIQLTFADGEGEQQAKLPLIGPEGGEDLLCGTFQFTDRGPATSVIIFEDEESTVVTGLGITYPDNQKDIVKVGTPTTDKITVALDENNVLAGFYGAINDETQSISQLGVIIHDRACTEAEIQEKIALNKLNKQNNAGEVVEDGDDSDIVIIIGIVVAALVIVGLLIAGLVCWLRKRNRKNVVTFLDTNQPPTTNNSHQALPDVATEDDNGQQSARADSKTSERKQIIV